MDIISKEQNERIIGSFDMEMVSGGNPSGIEYYCEKWAEKHKVKVKRFPPDWNNENPSRPDGFEGIIYKKKPSYYGGYNSMAGFLRNQEMVNYVYKNGGGIAIIFDTGQDKFKSPTKDILSRAKKAWIKVYHVKCKAGEPYKIKVYNEELQRGF